jgi:hypothetical protein
MFTVAKFGATVLRRSLAEFALGSGPKRAVRTWSQTGALEDRCRGGFSIERLKVLGSRLESVAAI